MWVHSPVTGFHKSGCVLTEPSDLCKLSQGKSFVQSSDCHYVFHIQGDVKVIHFVPISEDAFSIEPEVPKVKVQTELTD